jgi:hypothetical protein
MDYITAMLFCQRRIMITIPDAVFAKFITHLTKVGVPVDHFTEYKKWLRYYLDFCDKYSVSFSPAIASCVARGMLVSMPSTQRKSTNQLHPPSPRNSPRCGPACRVVQPAKHAAGTSQGKLAMIRFSAMMGAERRR